MSGGDVDRQTISAVSTASFTAAVTRFATGLSDSERHILAAALDSAKGPWQRMAARPAEELLDPAEARLLDRLVARAHRAED
ncbi:hypothetical protein [Streptomyces gilvosporeus]|uniref:hypothetical protein n=1 Tax=Streptomyces gilvosporeus TaxID=553510 RepID=UPI00131BC9DD|nr:hypothetical protein [Streptomyces gilvosporeus]